MNPALFVYIPTYNRPRALRRQLDSLTSQRGGWPGSLRVLVSDNASPLLSEDDLSGLRDEYDIEVRRNCANIDANANIALGFVFARPEEYLWILSDNDFLSDHALRAIADSGFVDDPDVIDFTPAVQRPTTISHTWRQGWSGIVTEGQVCLMSNVIYKASTVGPHFKQAFYYHNTSFPHLAVLLAALREQGYLRFRVLPRDGVFLAERAHGEQAGDYSLSLSGAPQIVSLLPRREAARFCREWLRDYGEGFMAHRHTHPQIHVGTRAALRHYGGTRVAVRLRLLTVRFAVLQPLLSDKLEPIRTRLPASVRHRVHAILRGRRW